MRNGTAEQESAIREKIAELETAAQGGERRIRHQRRRDRHALGGGWQAIPQGTGNGSPNDLECAAA